MPYSGAMVVSTVCVTPRRALFLVGGQLRRSRSAQAVSDVKKTNRIRLLRIRSLNWVKNYMRFLMSQVFGIFFICHVSIAVSAIFEDCCYLYFGHGLRTPIKAQEPPRLPEPLVNRILSNELFDA